MKDFAIGTVSFTLNSSFDFLTPSATRILEARKKISIFYESAAESCRKSQTVRILFPSTRSIRPSRASESIIILRALGAKSRIASNDAKQEGISSRDFDFAWLTSEWHCR